MRYINAIPLPLPLPLLNFNPSNFFSAIWNQFDGVTFVYADAEGVIAKIKGAVQHYLSKDKTAEYRKMALLGSLPKWKGFGVVDEEIQQMTATEAIEELDHVMYCLSDVWIEEHRNYRKKKPSQFDAREVNGPTFVMDCFFLWQPKHATVTRYCARNDV